MFIGDSGTGKTRLLTALCVAVCRQRRRVRFTTAAALVNEPVEAKQQLQMRRVLARWGRYDVIAIDAVLPASAGAVDDQLWHRHIEMFQAAQAHRAALVRALSEAVARLAQLAQTGFMTASSWRRARGL